MCNTEKIKPSYSIISKYRQVLMGISILAIILFHFAEDRCTNNYHANFLLTCVYKLIGSSNVDIFLILSGLGLFYSFKKNNNLFQFYTKHFVRLLVPFFLVAIPTFIVRDIIINHSGFYTFIKDLTFANIFLTKNRPFWYILCQGLCYLFFPYIFYLFDNEENEQKDFSYVLIFFALFMACNTALYVSNKTLFNNISIMTLRFFPFVFGVFIGKQAYNKKEIPSFYNLIILCSLFLMLLFVLLKKQNPLFHRNTLMLFNMTLLYFFLRFMDFIEIKVQWLWKAINVTCSFFGKITLELFLTHVAIRNVMNKMDYKTYYLKYELIMLGLTAISTIAIYFIMKGLMCLFFKRKNK